MAKGYRNVGMMERLGYQRRPKPAAPPARLPEQIAAERAKRDEFMRGMAASWGVAPEYVDLWLNDPVAYGQMMRERQVAGTQQ